MCGIAGVIYKQPNRTGEALHKMLGGCQHRGPDSTGLALYGPDPGEALVLRIFLAADLARDEVSWQQREEVVAQVLSAQGFSVESTWRDAAQMRIRGTFSGDVQKLSYAVEDIPGVEIFSLGHSLEILKDEGTADELEARFGSDAFVGYHGIGHVRLATESDVNPSTAHPFWAYGFDDVAIVHNGQITNYFKLKRRLEQRGFRFRTENDSEVIAVYLAEKMAAGTSMEEALEQSLTELDGTFSFLVSTPEGIGFAKDPIGAKPMVVCETDEVVAVASEEVSLRNMFGAQEIDTFEPFPGTSYTWSRSTLATATSAT
ncbi:MAG: amidophosphoribosyltransferase [Planctomycetota bacterium]|nr:MAG: amidophosphoribosyltransferase [Planctomycetota bacterium]REJ95173.1 MAG: amidophosphoribosyltransferase [Planctomycetota bacterium]REK29377.1 MAG: amidophosphoribosyltransferase [Planctomycetota bacterium]REK46792.1 MAG: amidophosphoribosyltransferase [Planctomycetota bacterium]